MKEGMRVIGDKSLKRDHVFVYRDGALTAVAPLDALCLVGSAIVLADELHVHSSDAWVVREWIADYRLWPYAEAIDALAQERMIETGADRKRKKHV